MNSVSSRLWMSLFLASGLFLFSFHVVAQEQPKEPVSTTATDTETTWPAAELTVGGQFQDGESEGMGDILVPVWPFSSGLLFVNPRASRTDHSEEEYNLGVGGRYLLPKAPVILGANTYYDYRETKAGSYNQWGFGLEVLTRWVDARVNYYKPENKETVADTTTEQQVETSSSTQSEWTDPFAAGHEIYQTLVTEHTTRKTTTTMFYEQYERAMEGFDGEIGLRLPLPVQPERLDARVFGGYYRFDADYGDDVEGGKARMELRLLSSLFLDAAWFENKDLTGSDYYVGGRLRVPFDLVELAHGRNPFAPAKSGFQGKAQPFSARLTEMVMRDPHVRTEVSDFIERLDLRQIDQQRHTDTQQDTVPILEDITFVGPADLDGDGTAEETVTSIQEGVDRSYGRRNVYVFDSGSAYEENVVLQPGVTLWGSGCPVPGFGGRNFGGASYPTLDGRSRGPAVTLASGSTVRGFRITNTDEGGEPVVQVLPGMGETDVSRVGVLGNDVTEVTVGCNLIEGARQGALFAREGSFQLSFLHNVVQNNDEEGLSIFGMGQLLTQEPEFEPAARNSVLRRQDEIRFDLLVDNSQFLNNGMGLDVHTIGYDSASVEISNSQFHGNDLDGARLDLLLNTVASVEILNSQANDNGDFGFAVLEVDSELASAHLSGVSVMNNGAVGAMVNLASSDWALTRIDQSQAVGNGLGFAVIMDSSELSLANLSGLSVRDNDGDGVMLSMYSEQAALGAIGMPEALAHTVKSFGLAGLMLPSELQPFFDSYGPVEVSGNQGSGIVSITDAEEIAALLLCDVTAEHNLGFGIHSTVISDEGVAIGLAGSSKNLMEVLQWGSGLATLADLEVPTLESSSGRMILNDNMGPGLSLTVRSDYTALAGVLGVEANRNVGMGVGVLAQSDSLALALAARVVSRDTLGNGLMVTADGTEIALGGILDSEATGNLGNGMNLSVTSLEGLAASLVASTDPLRSLGHILGEEIIGMPITAPGEPFGPVVADDNVGSGLVIETYGYEQAYGIVLDTQARGNGIQGIDMTVESPEGDAAALLLSSDLLFDLMPFGPIPHDSLGGLVANDNGEHGIRVRVDGESDALTVLAGLEASGNGNDGVNAKVNGVEDEAVAMLAAAVAHRNGGQGFSVELSSVEDDTMAFLVDVTAHANGRQGLKISATSTTANAYALLSGVHAASNSSSGITLDLLAGKDAAACLTDVQSVRNGGRGVSVDLLAGGNTALWGGTDALYEFTDHYELPSSLEMLADLAFPLITEGPIVTDENESAGLRADLHSIQGTAEFMLEDAQANNNDNAGLNINLLSQNGTVAAGLGWVTANGNDGRGVDLAAAAGGVGASDIALVHVTARTNGHDGLRIMANSSAGDWNVSGERIVSANNAGTGVRINAVAAGALNLDFGGGALDSEGQSSIFGNGSYDFRNSGAGTVMAENNWWGVEPPSALQFSGAVDYSPWLTSDPNP